VNSGEDDVFREATCACSDEVSAKAGKKEQGKIRVAHHGLDAHIVANVVCVAVIDDCAHSSVDDYLEV
jgi:hypothetical protein